MLAGGHPATREWGQIQGSHPILSLLATAMGCQWLYHAAPAQDGGSALPLFSLNFAEINCFLSSGKLVIVPIANYEESYLRGGGGWGGVGVGSGQGNHRE